MDTPPDPCHLTMTAIMWAIDPMSKIMSPTHGGDLATATDLDLAIDPAIDLPLLTVGHVDRDLSRGDLRSILRPIVIPRWLSILATDIDRVCTILRIDAHNRSRSNVKEHGIFCDPLSPSPLALDSLDSDFGVNR